MESPARIALNAHLLSGEASYRSAGIHGYIFNTVAHLPEADPELSYTVFVGDGRVPDWGGWHICRSRLPTSRPLFRILWEQGIAPLALRRIRPDLLHGMAFALPLAWNGPAVVTIYDLSFIRYPERLSRGRRLYLSWATQSAAQRARRIIAISESGKQEINDLLHVPLDRIDVAVPGASPHFRPLPATEVATFRSRHGLPERFILFVGTLEPRKNLETLLRAYAALPQRGSVKLVLAGDKGWQTESVFALIEQLALVGDVILPGYISSGEQPLWYNAAELFAYPSVYEGFGLPLIEAMACGTPVLAANTTSLPEAVGDAGLLIPPMEVWSWADALAALLENSTQRTALAESGQVWAKRFTWEKTARLTVAAYRRALQDRP